MGAGIAFAGLSWIAAGPMQLAIDDGEQLLITAFLAVLAFGVYANRYQMADHYLTPPQDELD